MLVAVILIFIHRPLLFLILSDALVVVVVVVAVVATVVGVTYRPILFISFNSKKLAPRSNSKSPL